MRWSGSNGLDTNASSPEPCAWTRSCCCTEAVTMITGMSASRGSARIWAIVHQPSRGAHLGVEGDHAGERRSSACSAASSCLAVAGLAHVVALELEVDPDEAPDLLGVVADVDESPAFHGGHPRLLTSAGASFAGRTCRPP